MEDKEIYVIHSNELGFNFLDKNTNSLLFTQWFNDVF